MGELLDPLATGNRYGAVDIQEPPGVVVQDPPGSQAARLAALTRLAVVQNLRQAGAALDRLWLDAAADDGDALRLAEAAQAVHRALVALI